jgi:ribose transport system substrate-binding protein
MQKQKPVLTSARHWCAAFTATVAATSLAACSSSLEAGDSSDDSGSSDGDTFTIGLASEGLNAPFPAAIAEGAQKAADEHGAKLIVLDGKLNETTQQTGIRTLIAQQVDGIIIDPIDPGPTTSMIRLAQAANIPVMLVHGYAGESADPVYPGVAYQLVENYKEMGEKAGQLGVDAVPDGGEVAVITGTPGYQAVEMLEDGIRSVIDASDRYDVVATQPGNWNVNDSYDACSSILSAHPDVALFVAQSDDMALGCSKAVKTENSDAAIVSSIGGTEQVGNLIEDESVYGMVCDAPATQGEMAMDAMYAYLTGKKDYDGTLEYYPTPAVTKDNLSTCKYEW